MSVALRSMTLRGVAAGVVLALGVSGSLGAAAAPDGAAAIAQLVNDYRAGAAACAGREPGQLAPLQRNARLAAVRVAPGRFLQQDLASAGYRALQAEAIGVSGAADPASVMALLRQHHCAALRNPDATDIGVAATPDGWTIVLARADIVPLLPSEEDAARAVLDATNRARAIGRHCGDQYFGPAPPLAPNAALDRAALAHSSEMAALRYFSHRGQDGGEVGERAHRAGYAWQHVGENIASGMRTPDQAVAGWVASPGHCANLMNAGFTDMGSGVGQSRESGIAFWTQVFGRR